MTIICFDNLTIEFGDRLIIQNFSASIQPGEFIGILGPNGAGKSTLIRSILGLIHPSQGQLLLFDKKPRRGDPRIGYIPQARQFFMYNRLSGKERLLVCLSGNQYGLPFIRKRDKQRAQELIELVGAEYYANRPFAELSGGEKQRLLLAQALINHPQLLLLDEPLASLDIKQQPRLIQLIQNIQQTLGVTVLLTAHDINPLLSALQRVIYIANGRCAIGHLPEVINSHVLSALYNTPIDVVEHQGHLLVLNHNESQQFCPNPATHPQREAVT